MCAEHGIDTGADSAQTSGNYSSNFVPICIFKLVFIITAKAAASAKRLLIIKEALRTLEMQKALTKRFAQFSKHFIL